MHKHTTLFLASLLIGATIPVTTSALYTRDNIRVHNGASQMNAAQTTKLSRRDDFSKALAIYQGLLQKGTKDLVKPDINKPETVNVYLKAYPDGVSVNGSPRVTTPASTKDYVQKSTDQVGVETLTIQERNALRKYMRIGKCWDGLQDFSPGFDALCKKMTRGKTPADTSGTHSDVWSMQQGILK